MTDFNKYGAAFKCSFITSLLVSGYVIGIYENHRCMDHEKLKCLFDDRNCRLLATKTVST